MDENYIKEIVLLDKTDIEKEEELLKSINRTKKILDQSHKNFEFAEEDLIDYYAYKIKANQSKLDYLIKLAKSKGIIMDTDLQIKANEKEVG
jgi:hypothetical protein